MRWVIPSFPYSHSPPSCSTDPRVTSFARLQHHIWVYDLEIFWLSNSGQSSAGWKINQASHTYLLSQEFVCSRSRGWAGMGASTHPGLCELSVPAWDWGHPPPSSLPVLPGHFFPFSIGEREKQTFSSFIFSLSQLQGNTPPIPVCFLKFGFVFVASCCPFVHFSQAQGWRPPSPAFALGPATGAPACGAPAVCVLGGDGWGGSCDMCSVWPSVIGSWLVFSF